MKTIVRLAALAALTLSACGTEGASAPNDVNDKAGFWDPGKKPVVSCAGYGSGGAYAGGYGGAECTEVIIVCSEQPCIRGQCVTTVESGDTCVCDEGYAGTLCDECAAGFVADGLVCVPTSDPCAEAPCLFGTCLAAGESFTCECDTGYQGERCDACAAGFHAEGLACVAD